MQKNFIPRSDEHCVYCGKRKAITFDKLFCRKCLRRLIRQTTPKPRTYIGSERLDRMEWDTQRFDCEIIDFDADVSLGGQPNYDSWFPPIDGQY
jgi:hypothetical protein